MTDEIRELLQKDDNELFVLIGEQLTGDQLGTLPLTPRQLAIRGKEWLSSNLTQIRPPLCSNQAVKAIRDKADSVALVCAIIDVVAKFCGVVSPVTVAVIILRVGLGRVCADEWKQEVPQ